MGTLSEIRKRSEEKDCSLCKLVWGAIKLYSNGIADFDSEGSVDQGTEDDVDSEGAARRDGVQNAALNSQCFMVWELDGRQAIDESMDTGPSEDNDTRYSNVSRRIRFWWTPRANEKLESYILFVPPPDPMVPNADGNKYRSSQFLAREFQPERSQYALIKSWLEICEKQHGPDCTGTYETTRFENLRRQTWFGVIDVVRMKLCKLPENNGHPEPYVALSYVWGKQEPREDRPDHRTKRANVTQRTQSGGIEERHLPKTIWQAIQLTRDLGLGFIWIDSLCIVQDSASSFKLNAAEMDLIYGNAYLTICAADGNTADDGLAALDPQNADKPLAEYVGDMRLLVSRPSEKVIKDSVWDQRGWTFQERILSRRCLVFVAGRFYFQCRRGSISQDIYPDATGRGLSMEGQTSPLRTLSWLQSRPIWFYMECVSLYTGRHLTESADILPAFEGVAGLIRTRMHGGEFLYGLPPSHFDLALLWEPSSAQRRRQRDLSNLNKYSQIENELPSWSWAGWMDAKDEMKGSPVRYKADTLDGCFSDVNEWIRQHTWIKWFIRDSSGDLRPIWNSDSIEEVQGILPRWRGYAASRIQQPIQTTQRTESFTHDGSYESQSDVTEIKIRVNNNRGLDYDEQERVLREADMVHQEQIRREEDMRRKIEEERRAREAQIRHEEEIRREERIQEVRMAREAAHQDRSRLEHDMAGLPAVDEICPNELLTKSWI